MKTCLWFTLISLISVAYGAVVVPSAPVEGPIFSKEAEADVLDKAGKTLETVGRILQGQNVDSTKEEQQEVLEVLQALTAGEGAEGDEAAEYIWPIIVRGAVAYGVKKFLDKRG